MMWIDLRYMLGFDFVYVRMALTRQILNHRLDLYRPQQVPKVSESCEYGTRATQTMGVSLAKFYQNGENAHEFNVTGWDGIYKARHCEFVW